MQKKIKKNMDTIQLKSSVKSKIIDAFIAIAAFAVATGLGYLLDYFHVNSLNFIILYVLAIQFTAVLTKGYLYSSVLSFICMFGYNFFFTVPRYSFDFNDRMYMVTFVLMLAVGIFTSTITFSLKKKMAQVNALNMEKAQLKNEAEKEQLKATMLRSISHDLRTPLTTMKNGAEILLTTPNLEDADKTEILNDICSKANWTVRLVENLLSLSRIDNENFSVKKSMEAVEEIIPQAVRNCRDVLGTRKVHYDLPDELLMVPMDATLILQALGNILTNAARHSVDTGQVWIKVWNSGRHAVFRVTNDGEPIKEIDLPHIFEMYYTTGDGKRGKGVGLGLAICKLIITAHGGTIKAENTEDGKVQFEFTLPMENK